MADLTLEILQNREKYPDDREIVLGDGETVTVKQFRDALQPRAEFTRASEGWKTRERELQGAVEGLSQQLRDAMTQQQVVAPAQPRPTGGISDEDLEADPVLGPIVKRLRVASERLESHEERLKGHESYVLEREYRGKLGDLAGKYNSRFNADGTGKAFDQKQFLDFCLQRKIADLDTAYDAWSRPDEISRVTAEAEARGEERGKQHARVPQVPFGRRRAAGKPDGLPTDFQSVTEEMIADDPEIREAMSKDQAG